MNLSIFFEPLYEDVFAALNKPRTLGSYISRFVSKFPDWRAADIAILGINETRGSGNEENTDPALAPARAVRKKLYALNKGAGSCKIVDLGNLRPGISLDDTYLRIKEIVEVLISHGTIPVLIGGSHDLEYGQFMGYEHLERVVNMVTVDSSVDMTEDTDANPNKKQLRNILMHEPNYLFSLGQIGYQSYLVESEVMATLEKMHFEAYRVGEVHRNVQEMEPVVRLADLLTIDVAAIRHQDAPGYEPANPFGLTGEEACQLCWYAGLNDNLTSLGIYEYNPELDERELTAMTVATMIWYFIEGFYHRKNEISFNSKQFTKYAVAFNDNPDKMVFYKSKQSEKWWLEVESLTEGKTTRVVPCSYEDYLQATKGEVPNRWILTQARIG
ncbi:formimidoylglutamase [Pontibacter sp. BT310]|uniref:Formimidoylglutamase n=1 Tax=Pontibacter populi TaxID=890055 RepID=A0ABS6XFF3_9BACT|nr:MULTISPECIES: formimidoylglutamase [Pontibacter]MBJ6119871.1 formimidoylglutamase [Pontibacter sp. BT310]MBR0572300.1 formimidoylglutamase [Microvirga sp. STS03]MBW3366724.1 formimidoylglutamase [Pontibacter populi]